MDQVLSLYRLSRRHTVFPSSLLGLSVYPFATPEMYRRRKHDNSLYQVVFINRQRAAGRLRITGSVVVLHPCRTPLCIGTPNTQFGSPPPSTQSAVVPEITKKNNRELFSLKTQGGVHIIFFLNSGVCTSKLKQILLSGLAYK